jgi:sulfoquinovosyltransferase
MKRKTSFLCKQVTLVVLATMIRISLASEKALLKPRADSPHSSLHHHPLRICVLVEPSPITYVSGYANRFQALLEYLALGCNDEVQIVTTEVVVKERPSQFLGVIPIRYTAGIRLPCYPQMSVSVDYTFKAVRTVASMKPDLIHASSPGFLVFGGLLCSRLFQIPLVISYHTHLPVYVRTYAPRPIRRLTEWASWQAIRAVHSWADLTLVTSPQIRAEFEQHGIPRVQVWQKGIDTDRFHPRYRDIDMRRRMTNDNPDAFLVVYVGRLGGEKRLRELRDVLTQIPTNGTRLCLVGHGPQDEELRDYFRDNTPTVFTGMLHGEELSRAFASADAFCMPSDSETLGLVVLESMASGVPVVAAAAGGLTDLIHDGTTGFLVPTGNTTAFAERLRQLKDDPELRAKMGVQARIDMEKWSWQASMAKLRTEQYRAAQDNFSQRIEQRLWRLFTFNWGLTAITNYSE